VAADSSAPSGAALPDATAAAAEATVPSTDSTHQTWPSHAMRSPGTTVCSGRRCAPWPNTCTTELARGTVGTDSRAADAVLRCSSASSTPGTTHAAGARVSINQSPATHPVCAAELSSAASAACP
jgi:hypothetical protein